MAEANKRFGAAWLLKVALMVALLGVVTAIH